MILLPLTSFTFSCMTRWLMLHLYQRFVSLSATVDEQWSSEHEGWCYAWELSLLGKLAWIWAHVWITVVCVDWLEQCSLGKIMRCTKQRDVSGWRGGGGGGCQRKPKWEEKLWNAARRASYFSIRWGDKQESIHCEICWAVKIKSRWTGENNFQPCSCERFLQHTGRREHSICWLIKK